MTDDTDTGDWEPTDERTEDDSEAVGGADTGGSRLSGAGDDRSLGEYVQWALFVILVLLVAIAALRFYFAASTAVDRFVTRQYRPLFQAAFNVVILLAAGVGLSVLVRRLS